MMPLSAAEAQTVAGTPITNIAALRYDASGQPQTIQSNAATLIIAERLDVRLSRVDTGLVTLEAGATPIAFDLVNAGNGQEAFQLAESGAATLQGFAIDVDGNGVYDPARDTLLTDAITPVLTAGQTLKLFAIVTSGASDGSLSVTARAVTGSGEPGTSFVGKGDGGGDAVVGPTSAAATIAIPFGSAIAGPTLVKSQVVLANDGSAIPYRDSIVTYTLEARFVSALSTARVDDPIPAGTAYVPGSLTLDGMALSDSIDSDAGQFDAGGIAVMLAGVAANAVHTIQFKVKIQ